MSRTFRHRATPRLNQRGAVLYVAMIMLILLALLGLVGMQVTGMQERMSANYGRVNTAFQGTEAQVRKREVAIQQALFGATGTYEADEEICSATFDPLTWADAATGASAVHTRRIDKCFAASSLVVGKKKNEETGNIYQITLLSGDTPSDPAATAVIDTIYIP